MVGITNGLQILLCAQPPAACGDLLMGCPAWSRQSLSKIRFVGICSSFEIGIATGWKILLGSRRVGDLLQATRTRRVSVSIRLDWQRKAS